MRIKTYAAIVLLSAGALIVPAAAAAQGAQPSFDQTYAKYVDAASSLRTKVQQGNAPLADQKAYFDAVLRVLISQNSMIAADLETRNDGNLADIRMTLVQDGKKLEGLLTALAAAKTDEEVRTVADAVKGYIDSYKTSVRQPMLGAYVARFAAEVLQPAQKRHVAMKQAVAAAKQKGVKVKEYETALEVIRLKLYEVKGLTDDIQASLADTSFTIEEVEADMVKAQEIMKGIYASYKDLSLKSAGVLAQ